MAFTCAECGYKNSEVKGGGAVPAKGSEVILYATSEEDLKRCVLLASAALLRLQYHHTTIVVTGHHPSCLLTQCLTVTLSACVVL
jgi:C4-type Zn-finger protein